MYRRNPYNIVIPAQAGIHAEQDPDTWVPAYAGTTSGYFMWMHPYNTVIPA